jgi:Flp pilus assembly protein TadG
MPNSAFLNASVAAQYYVTFPWGNASQGAGAGTPFYTVTPNGPYDGGTFGPGTPGTTTGGNVVYTSGATMAPMTVYPGWTVTPTFTGGSTFLVAGI